MRKETVTLAGAEYEICELPLRKNAEWRQLAADEFSAYTDLLGDTQTLELSDTNGVVMLMRKAGDMIFKSPERVVNLVFAYAPELANTNDADVYESELMEALAACLRLAFPFGKLTRLISSLAETGSVPITTETTSKNSNSPVTETSNG